jgi:hypothetical protein
MNTYLKAAHEVVTGDIVCESDGFMWTVMEISFNRGRYTFLLLPHTQSMTARATCNVTVKRSASVRVAR